jgi:hypothetical protein
MVKNCGASFGGEFEVFLDERLETFIKPSLPQKFRAAAESLNLPAFPLRRPVSHLKTTTNHKIVAFNSPFPLDSGLNFIFADTIKGYFARPKKEGRYRGVIVSHGNPRICKDIGNAAAQLG